MDYDVIVAGGGPTGLWLACELALARVRVVVLERLVKPTGLSRALGLQRVPWRCLSIRASSTAFAAGNPILPFLNFAMFPLDLRRLDFPHPYGVVIPQARIEALLEEPVATVQNVIQRVDMLQTGTIFFLNNKDLTVVSRPFAEQEHRVELLCGKKQQN